MTSQNKNGGDNMTTRKDDLPRSDPSAAQASAEAADINETPQKQASAETGDSEPAEAVDDNGTAQKQASAGTGEPEPTEAVDDNGTAQKQASAGTGEPEPTEAVDDNGTPQKQASAGTGEPESSEVRSVDVEEASQNDNAGEATRASDADPGARMDALLKGLQDLNAGSSRELARFSEELTKSTAAVETATGGLDAKLGARMDDLLKGLQNLNASIFLSMSAAEDRFASLFRELAGFSEELKRSTAAVETVTEGMAGMNERLPSAMGERKSSRVRGVVWLVALAAVLAGVVLGVVLEEYLAVLGAADPSQGWMGWIWESYGAEIVECVRQARTTGTDVECSLVVDRAS